LVVDDEPDLRTLYELTLLREGYAVEVAQNVQEALEQLAQHRFDVLITDMRLPDGLGLALIHKIRQDQRSERSIVITAYGSTENAVEALKAGAFDYLTKPVELKQFRSVVASAARSPADGMRAAAGSSPQLPGAPGTQALTRLVGQSECMRRVKERILKAAPSMAPVLVTGESGTGKELAARAIHANSHRANGPWVAVNCSAIPESLLEAEFFGAKKGAYTGAQQDREGFFQAARGGTLFLDEIGELPLAMQSKLLRAIQERKVRPLGSSLEEAVDVRIISATHRNLSEEVQQGRFRQDLYYRINVIDIRMTPLRERLEDLPDLCQALLAHIAHESGQPCPELPAGFLASLANLPLEGNVRELENLLYRCATLGEEETNLVPPNSDGLPQTPPSTADTALPDAWAPAAAAEPALPADLQAHLDAVEREVLVRALRSHQFNRTAAAQTLGLSLRQIRYRMARLHIEPPTCDLANDDDTT
jgi:two-component system response regulator PilR (NtrC family)